MRRIAWILLLIFAFAIPWEYSLDLGEPLGNAARIAGVLTLLAAIPAVLQSGRLRIPCAFCWVALAYFLWFVCSMLWSIEPELSFDKLRAFFQEIMIVWLAWELAEGPEDLRWLLRATVAGSWLLAILTLAAFRSPEAMAAGQIRFAAYGQDPNEVARFLDLGFPLAALLANCERRWPLRLMALGFLPLGLAAVLLTASREGFVAAVLGLAGSAILLMWGQARRLAACLIALPPLVAAFWFLIPSATLERLATIPEQLHGGDLNQRVNIWSEGWKAFTHAPLVGSGAGTFVAAAHLAPIDTAHNTALSLVVTGGLCALMLAFVLVALAARAALATRGAMRLMLVTSLVVWASTALVATVEENRTTWLLFAIVILAARMYSDDPEGMGRCFASGSYEAPTCPPVILVVEA